MKDPYKTIETDIIEIKNNVKDIIAIYLTGSHLRKLNDEQSDYDYYVIVKPSIENLINVKLESRVKKINEDLDCQIWDVFQFNKIINKCNMNLVEMLEDKPLYTSNKNFTDFIYNNRNTIIKSNINRLIKNLIGNNIQALKYMEKYDTTDREFLKKNVLCEYYYHYYVNYFDKSKISVHQIETLQKYKSGEFKNFKSREDTYELIKAYSNFFHQEELNSPMILENVNEKILEMKNKKFKRNMENHLLKFINEVSSNRYPANENVIFIKVDENLCALVGEKTGIEMFEKFVEPNLESLILNEDIEIQFSSNLYNVSSSFVQGFLKKLIETNGYYKVETLVKISSEDFESNLSTQFQKKMF